jgi:DNA-binding helix-turn-helix protein
MIREKVDYNKIGETLKKYREKAGMTIHEVANKVGVVDNTIYKYEHGISQMTVDKLRKLAKVLNFRLEDIFGETTFDDKSLSVGQIVRTKRRFLGLSKLELANVLGYSTASSIKNIEEDEYDIPMNRMEAFCSVLGLKLADLIIGSKVEPKKQYHWNISYEPEDFSNKGGEEMDNNTMNKELNILMNINKDNYTVDLEFIDKSKDGVDLTEYVRYGSRLHIGILAEDDLHRSHNKDCTCRICSALQKYSIKCDDIGIQIRDVVSHYLKVLKENSIQSLTAKKKLVIEEVYKDSITITVEGDPKMNHTIITSEMYNDYYNGDVLSIGDICDYITETYGYNTDNYRTDIAKFLDTIYNNFSDKDYEYNVSMILNIRD